MLGFYEAAQEPAIIEGTFDDAPIRAFGLMLVGFPIIYVTLAVLSAVCGLSLLALGMRSLRRSLLAASMFAVAISAGGGTFLADPGSFGTRDAALTVLAVVAIDLMCALPGAVTWWFVAHRGRSSS
ncbi:hypothetical protein [Methylibium petroleiphilum]|uniref:Transmembrane protein n=1 Tax=Methylibium petroleiphilum (strain ATCC BAA-1232 / LMG 22953 / PM1) TaxID=420662 RepID=A2SP54_METPP|nr:hypothetical protein [Methylibium petroleiphilum]ABM97343.1 hypothetical protein Mpe_B0576 [Methylibium petroleiphilum PM1]